MRPLKAQGAVIPGQGLFNMSGFAVVAQGLYIATGLVLAWAPRAVYGALFFAPVLIIWKLWLYGRLLFGVRLAGWIRTVRNDQRGTHRPLREGPALSQGSVQRGDCQATRE